MFGFGKWRVIATALQKLIADKEDTKQVFIILQAMGRRSSVRSYKRFRKSANAEKILRAERPLVSYLKDRKWLAAQPEGSLGRAYLDFTVTEQISADGLTQASVDGGGANLELTGDHLVFSERQRDAHDLWHVATGYGRDGLGELSLLAFTWRQLGNPGILMIIAMGYHATMSEAPQLRIGKAIREGFTRGRKTHWLPAANWEYLLTRPLDEVRRTLNITPPKAYDAVADQVRELEQAALIAAE